MILYMTELALWMAVTFLAGCLIGAVLRLSLGSRRAG